jgi:hypothetical protein
MLYSKKESERSEFDEERDCMKKRTFGNFQVELDVDTTAKWYAQSKGWGCECSHCRNFLELANKKELPKHILETLAELCIPPEKATLPSIIRIFLWSLLLCEIVIRGDTGANLWHFIPSLFKTAGYLAGRVFIHPISS